MAAAHAIGRTGSTISPLLIGWAATNFSITLGIALLGVSYAICGLIPGFFIREKMYDPAVTAHAA
jgi:AAHS family cis,cis-muconate transporter-like MFS transporter